jgi:hypothetical protein
MVFNTRCGHGRVGIVMSDWRPPLVTRWLVEWGVWRLVLADRVRFREELPGGMYSLPKRRQLGVALSFWRGSGAPRRALYSGRDQGFLVPRGDWRCQLRRHHMVRIHDREAGGPHSYYLECSRYGRHFDVHYYPPAGIVA